MGGGAILLPAAATLVLCARGPVPEGPDRSLREQLTERAARTQHCSRRYGADGVEYVRGAR